MRQRALKLTIILTTLSACMITNSYAQSFFGTKPSTTTKIMSADDFKNMVNTLGQQNQTALTQQLGQQLKQPPLKPASTPTDSSGSSSTSTTTTITTPSTSSSTQTTSTTPSTQTLPSNVPPPAPRAPIYTGFGGSDNNQKSPSATSTDGNSDGFKINY